ncbi:LuxR C-terminal-related transcriptional regulator [Actinocrispum wychmicini]|uniref:LuxR family maltose regulon positive regulatory protein n=1 Tax=Actinocrispum wychmicini TaxID=1213861 RepID=A0A4R2IRN4_9PSEU|nr:LuxR C-terminal-related transcriptional regulator [Actinocrispum wychmicini]TCO47382.1 LuxR family maltose regulon positive regulatory protein [Actinocrispum wychmicini]
MHLRISVASAKVTMPVTASTMVIRDRLEVLVDAAVARRALTVVCAPAGTGKTTMLAGWARRRMDRGDMYVAWMSVDCEDNDSALLWLALLRALKCSGAWRDECPLDGLIPPNGESYAAFVNAVIAAFDGLDKPMILVVDGVHDVRSADAVHTLDLLLRHLPSTLRLVLATRFPPPLMLPRLKLEGRLAQIGPDELTFTRDEARLLYANEGVRLTETALDLVMERTEGWAAALRVAVLTAADASVGVAEDDRAMAEYLTAEIFGRQSRDVQWFMLTTSACRAVSADLAVALSGQQNAGQVLDLLDRTGIMVPDRGMAPGWYRYHPLLRGYLWAELGRRGTAAQQHQNRVAAGWFAGHDDPLGAVEHGIAAGDDDRASRLLAKTGLELVLKGQSGRLCEIVRTVPEHVGRRPSVALVAAAASLDSGDVATAERFLRGLGKLPTRRLQALHAAVQVHRSRLLGDAADVQAHTGRTGDRDVDLLALVNRGIAHAWTGRHGPADADLRSALTVANAEQRDAIALECQVHLAGMAVVRGDLTELRGHTTAALELATARGWTGTSRSAYLYTLLGVEAYQRLDDEGARRHAARAMELMAPNVDPTIDLSTCTLWAMISYDAAKDPHRVATALHRLWQRLDGKAVSPALVAYTAPTRQRMALRVGETQWAIDVIDHMDSLTTARGESALLRAILNAHKGRISTTRRLLAPVLDGQTRVLLTSTLIDAWLLEAHLADRCDMANRAHEALCRALTLAAPHRVMRPFREAGYSVRDLLVRDAGRFGRLEPFATDVRDRLPVSVPTVTDGLTEREQELLTELPSMRTAGEIAETMFVSVNTVKTHLRGIYRKLGVSQRRDAISVARERGLL